MIEGPTLGSFGFGDLGLRSSGLRGLESKARVWALCVGVLRVQGFWFMFNFV